jgi:hypothetical protein
MRSFRLSSRCTRFAAPALAGATLLGGVLAQAPAAHADFLWCWDDPVVVVNGTPVHIDLGIQGSPSQVHASIAAANIVVHVQAGATAVVPQSNTPDYPATVTVKFDKGGVWKSGPVPIQVDTTFVQQPHAPALNSKETVSTASATRQAQATIQGSMNLDFSVQ